MDILTVEQVNQQAAWQFEVSSNGGVAGTFAVERGTGRWAHTINIETGKVGRSVYAYDARFTSVNGLITPTTITRDDLLKLRRAAKRQSERQSERDALEGEARP